FKGFAKNAIYTDYFTASLKNPLRVGFSSVFVGFTSSVLVTDYRKYLTSILFTRPSLMFSAIDTVEFIPKLGAE
ncbi:hypothetical protein, partial [Sodalis sp.]|uniref:hypothetical protein n=1 Tax=Sodalis sp. (in: enterobacteria) TaxID=1898979 RepID=UPI003872A989